MIDFLEYKLIAQTPLNIPTMFDTKDGGIISGSTLKGMTRRNFRYFLGMDQEEEKVLFGDIGIVGKIAFEDIVYHGPIDETVRVAIDSSKPELKNLYTIRSIPPKAELQGRIAITSDITIRQINIIRHSIYQYAQQDVGFGSGRAAGYGQVLVKYPDVNSTGLLFLSYALEDEEHNEWALSLADQLSNSNFLVIFDEYEIGYGDNCKYFMEQAVQDADKILVVMTPEYKRKSASQDYGVGVEISLMENILSRSNTQKTKFIPILRKGDVKSSIPSLFKNLLFLDMRDDKLFEKNFKSLYFAILGKKEINRPPLPWPDA